MDTNALVALLACGLTLAATLGVAVWVGRRAKADDWTTGGRKLPVYVVIGTQFATMLGGGVLVGQVGVGYESGWATVVYGALTAVGIIPLVLLVKWLRERDLTSLPDVLGRLYGRNRAMDVITIVMSIVIPFGWLCSNLVAFGNLFSAVLGVDARLLIPIFGLICLGFVLPAGLTSVAWTDFIFGIGMVIFAVVSVIYTLNYAGGWGTVQATIPDSISSFPSGMWSVGGLTILFWVLAVMPGNLTNQQLYQRVFAADSNRSATMGLLFSAGLYFLALVWAAVMGMSVRAVAPDLENPEMATGWLLSQIPVAMLAIFASFIAGTLMSTASSAIQSCVVNLTKDIYADYINPQVSEKKMLRMSRGASIVIIALAVALAVFYSQALAWLVMTFAYSVSALLVPIFAGYFLRKTSWFNAPGAVGSMLSGVVGAAVAHISGTEIPYVAFGMLASLVGLFVFSALARTRNKESVTV